MTVFLAMAAFILMLVAPFLVIIIIGLIIIAGIIFLIRGLRKAKPTLIIFGIVLLIAGTTSGHMIIYWATTEPQSDNTSRAHELVHESWKQTRLRFKALKWINDGTFDRLNKKDKEK